MLHSTRIPPPLIEGLSRRHILRTIALGIGTGIGLAECYWHFHVLPGRAERDAFFAKEGIEFERVR